MPVGTKGLVLWISSLRLPRRKSSGSANNAINKAKSGRQRSATMRWHCASSTSTRTRCAMSLVWESGDRIPARFMRQDFFEYTPQFKLIIAGNHKPGLRSVDEAIRRRFNLIPFIVTIPPDERDETLPE